MINSMRNHSQEDLLKYYLRELQYLREMGAAFRERYPHLAERLHLGDQESTDPHVERLLESFAFLTGRIQYNLEREFPEIPAALLGTLYPHLQNPIPSMAIAQFEVDPQRGKLTDGYTIPRQTPLFAETQGGQVCRFQTSYPVMLWPLSVAGACLLPATPHGPVLWLRLQAHGAALNELALNSLRFHLQGSQVLVNSLCELLTCHVSAVHLLPPGAPHTPLVPEQLKPISQLPPDSLRPVGFDLDEAVLPFPPQSHPAYRLLQEYFAFPKKFHFWDVQNIDVRKLGAKCILPAAFISDLERGGPATTLCGCFARHNLCLLATDCIVPDQDQANLWQIVRGKQPLYTIRNLAEAGDGPQLYVFDAKPAADTAFDLWIVFDPKYAQTDLEFIQQAGLVVNRETFRLGCTPIINLFSQTSEPIRLDHRQTEYLLVPDARHESITEIYEVQKVVAVSEGGSEIKPLAPFYGLNHGLLRRNQKAFWYARRQPSMHKKLPGTELSLAFVDLDFNPSLPDAQTIYAETLCTNRQLAAQLPPGARLQVEFPVPAYRITCLGKPTPQIGPPLHGATLWRLVSQLSLNHLSLDDTVQFGAAKGLRRALENNNLPQELRQRFEHHGIALSGKVIVSNHTQARDGTSWLITDQENGEVYTVIADADQLSVYTGQEALPALREMLALYSAAEPARTYDLLMGIEAIICRRVARRLGPRACWQGLARGLEITLIFDETRYPARETMLFAAVLNRFFPLYASMNMFTQLVVKSKGHEGEWKRWPPMVGAQPIL